MLSALDLRSEISNFKSAKAVNRSIKHKTERHSPAKPREMYRNVNSSGVVPRSKPSAMLFETETGPLKLILQAVETLKLRARGQREHFDSEFNRSPPNGQFFETVILHVRNLREAKELFSCSCLVRDRSWIVLSCWLENHDHVFTLNTRKEANHHPIFLSTYTGSLPPSHPQCVAARRPCSSASIS